MKFKVGDIVRKVAPYWIQGFTSWDSGNEGKTLQEQIDMQPGDKYDIENRTEFIISEVYGGEYEIMEVETGCTNAWWHDCQLEFVREGGEDMVQMIAEKGKRRGKEMQTLPWIKAHYPNDLSWDSWNSLLCRVGWDSAFNRNGEFFCLIEDVEAWTPVFNAIAKNDCNAAIEEFHNLIKPEYWDRFEDKIRQLCEEWNNV